jgi:hypothetical protein
MINPSSLARASRWPLFALAAALLATPVAPAAEPAVGAGAQSWNFRVFLNDDPIGYHNFTLTPRGDTRELQSVAHFQVKILFISAYHYDHQASELWHGDCLRRLDSSSDDNGKHFTVHAAGDGDSLDVAAPSGQYVVKGCAMTFAYWNPVMLQQSHLINPETGENLAVTIQPVGDEEISVRGVAVRARHYHMHASKLEIDLWYSPAGDWLALESPSEKGRRLRYVRE